ncbi:MAG: GerMN domain-containing protein [Oscillospiraceae bacterium]
MKWKRLLLLLLLLGAVAAVACAGREAGEQGQYALYYLAADPKALGGDAVRAEYCDLALSEEPQTAAQQLLERYWAGPQREDLMSPLPDGLQLLEAELSGGRLRLDVSSSYGMLSGVELTLADSCLTLTLTQLPGVYSVAVTVNGKPLEYRAVQELQARDVLLSTAEDLVATLEARLWFIDTATGELAEESRKIPVYEGKTRAESVLDALVEGPEGDKLRSAFPEGYAFLSVRVEEESCYVNLSSQALTLLEGGEAAALEAAARSLCSLSTVSSVRYLVDGETADRYGAARIDEPYFAQN